ncbi:PREDICTED: interleukin-6 [Gekko japonicus]|uniref:Interleukin-6 n=1 Tax=Gekko japonicus TaxID=146911 RepID=A0ABM1KIE4_GEKJA|nr:PREDICTED: interleukin-6 [Gekko japonicus]
MTKLFLDELSQDSMVIITSLLKGCLLAAAALPLLLGASASPILDSSGEEQFSEDPSSRTSPARDLQLANCKYLAIMLRRKAFTWKEELCKEQTICKNNTEIILQNNLHFPKISVEDECPPRKFNKERCLRGISDGLYVYQAFLEYIEETFVSKEQETAFIWPRTKHLANTLKSMMNTPDTVSTPNPATKEALSTQLRAHTGWNRKVIHYLILQNYISFMEKTVRAIRAVRGWESECLTSGA